MNSNNRSEKNAPAIDYISYAYGLAIIIGGAVGFIKAGIDRFLLLIKHIY